MRADSISVRDFFMHERRHLVPLYQRPYVWGREAQWEPLWSDVRTLAERLMAGQPARAHFLGAVVLEQAATATREVAARLVIDGQQRLTTLQIMLAAFRDVCAQIGNTKLARQLDRLTRNDDPDDPADEQCFKVWPTNVDRAPFRAIMKPDEGTSVQERLALARKDSKGGCVIADAYEYFHGAAKGWLGKSASDGFDERLAALLEAVRNKLVLVAIDLDNEDEAQVIFETLNARGTPLLPADLVKNYLLHRAELEQADAEALYRQYWKPFDEEAEFWRSKVRQGRLRRPQVDLFLQHYLTLAMCREVSASHLYAEFRDHAANQPDATAERHLISIQECAQVFRQLSELTPDTAEGTFFHRLRQMDTTTVMPVLLGLFRKFSAPEFRPAVFGILQTIESYLVRRLICRLTTRGYNHLFIEMLSLLRDADRPPAARIAEFLASQEGDSRRWPDDRELKAVWMELPAYKALSRARVSMILEALEAAIRTDRSERIMLRGRLTVEHIMPQAWQEHWDLPATASPDEATARREALIHTFGNLTLLTDKLNPAISNSGWERKQREIGTHSALALNRELAGEPQWNEETIQQRSRRLLRHAINIWPHVAPA